MMFFILNPTDNHDIGKIWSEQGRCPSESPTRSRQEILDSMAKLAANGNEYHLSLSVLPGSHISNFFKYSSEVIAVSKAAFPGNL